MIQQFPFARKKKVRHFILWFPQGLVLGRPCWLMQFWFPDTFVINLPHVEQAENWDCGLACIQMVLSDDEAINLRQNMSVICSEEYQNKRLFENNNSIIYSCYLCVYKSYSTWTIDLCYILNHFSVKIKYYTKTLGVNPSFSQERFYNNYIIKVTIFHSKNLSPKLFLLFSYC